MSKYLQNLFLMQKISISGQLLLKDAFVSAYHIPDKRFLKKVFSKIFE